MVRRVRHILLTTREIHGALASALVRVPGLDDDNAGRLRRMSRSYAVQVAAMAHSPWWSAYAAARIGSAALVVAAPAAVIAPLYVASPAPVRIAAAALYASFLAVLATGWHYRRGVVEWPRTIAVWSALALLVVAADVVMPRSWQAGERRAVWLAALGVAALLALVAARFAAVVWLRDRHIRPLAFRAAGGPLPAQLVAVRLLVLANALHEARSWWWHPRRRADLLRWLAGHRAAIAAELRGCSRDAGLGAAHTERDERRAGHLTAVLEHIERRLADAAGPEEYHAIEAEVVAALQALARGDWSPLTLSEDPARPPGRLRQLVRRALPAAVLAAAALALPLLPGRPAATDAAVTTVQLGLFVAAALNLLPIDADVRGRVADAYTSAGRIGP